MVNNVHMSESMDTFDKDLDAKNDIVPEVNVTASHDLLF